MGLVKCPDCGKEVSDRAQACPNCGCPREFFPGKKLQTGDSCYFGRWGDEDIEWRVLDVKEDRALLIARQAVDCRQYNGDMVDTNWKDCSLRSWLNGAFLEGAFSSNERSKIAVASLTNRDNDLYGIAGGPDTEDRIFCLSVDEAHDLFSSGDDLVCYPMRGAKKNGAWTNEAGACFWWLRSPGENQFSATYVDRSGNVRENGSLVSLECNAVRPALWLYL